MAEQVPFSIMEHMLTKLGSSAYQEIQSMYGVAKELGKLKEKLGIIKGVLLDAEEQQQKNHAVQEWLQSLKTVMYDADDLLDDYETYHLQRGGLARQVSHFFSSSNQCVFRLKMSHRLKDINESLDDIEKNIPMLNVIPRDITHTRVNSSWRDTHSFVLASEIVGRDENKEEIVTLLLSDNNEENLSVVAIVGIGGLGKTTLAQLVYNDGRVKEHFEPRIWACISDDSGDGFDVNMWIRKILKSASDQNVENLSLEIMTSKLHEKISQRKFLLVLDDVWNQNSEKWEKVRVLLMVGAKGSKIVVTTRKTKVASIMGNNSPCLLKGLEENQSWNLFSKIAFREGLENVHPNIIEIGKEIAKMCKGVPLIIKTLGTMLQFESEEQHWLSIKNNENLLSLGDGNDDVLPVLKLSYDNLPTHLRQCFGYCALFPKDYEIEKELLVQLWIAQGYIQPSYKNEHLEDVGDQYFKELLSRSLLEEVEKDAFDNILSCKMHDLIHDLAQSIIGSDILILRKGEMTIPEKVHHVSLCKPFYPMVKTLKTKPIRTFLNLYEDEFADDSITNSVIPSFKCLRVLSLYRLNLKEVPKCLGKLSHLRYLDLSFNHFKVLPNSITKLKNLQTLRVMNCCNLERFPKFTRELINLRHLRNKGCVNLTQMPYGIGQLTLLQSLSLFVVGTGQPGDHKIGGLSELKGLNQLRGVLRISNLENVRDVVPVSRGEILKGKQYLRSLTLEWKGWWDENGELVMEGLQPHRNLKELFIEGYGGRRFPSWMMNDGLGSLLPNLIKIEIKECSRCQILPPFSQLPSLQSLVLSYMREVEGMKEGSSATNAEFFPALQFLKLYSMPKLKGLWRMELGAEQGLSFPCLSQLDINGCSNLTSIQLSSSPSLSTITIWNCDKLISLQLHSSSSLSLSTLEIGYCHNLTSLELPSSPCLSHLDIQACPNLTSVELHSSPSLSTITIGGCDKLISLKLHSSSSLSLSALLIRHCPNLTSLELPSSPCLEYLYLSRVREEVLRQIMFVSASSSLKSLSLGNIDDTTCISLLEQLLQHVSTLQTLHMWDCPELMTSLPQEMPSLKTLQLLHIDSCSGLTTLPHWIGSLTSLTELQIHGWSELTSLPEEIHSLKALQMLDIDSCSALATLPHSIGNLTSLKELHISDCPELTSLPEEIHSLKTLQMLNIVNCSALATLPHSIGSLTSLKELSISNCPELTSLPEEMRSLNNLQMLRIDGCPHLEERCQKETGEDWPKISYIPRIQIC